MADGLRVWDASGNLIIDVTDRLTRILGSITIATNETGSVTNDGFLTGTPLCIAVKTGGSSGESWGFQMVPPTIWFSGNVMSYVNTSNRAPHLLIYGVN